MRRALVALTSAADATLVREEKFNGAPHLVVPLVALVEGVVRPGNGNGDGELALMSEVGRFPEGWNARPVVLNHPVRNGLAVSASDMTVQEDGVFGQLFNTLVEDEKLKTEAWINLDRITALAANDKPDAPDTSEYATLVEALKTGSRVVEVSVGVFVTAETAEGNYKGAPFKVMWRNVVPDHLAFLSEGRKGACSAEMGCGAPRLNSLEVLAEFEEGEECRCKQLPTGNEGGEKEVPATSFQKLKAWLGEKLQFRSAASNGLSDIDTRAALSAALAEKSDSWCYVVAVFDNTFVYEEGYDGKLYQRSFTIDTMGKVTLGADEQIVRPVTSFVPVVVGADDGDLPKPEATQPTLEDATMTLKERVAALVALTTNPFTNDDLTWLENLDEAAVTALEKKEFVVASAPPAPAPKPAEPAAPVVNNAPAPVDTETFISAAPKELQQVLRNGLKLQNQYREGLIKQLSEIPNTVFSAEELKAMDTEMLEKMARLASVPTYDVLGTRMGVLDSGDHGVAPAAPAVFA